MITTANVIRFFFNLYFLACVAYLLSSMQLDYLTRWCAVVRAIMYIPYLPVRYITGTPLLLLTFSFTWTVAIGISIITAQGNVMTSVTEQYGAALAWTGNVLMHYLPLLIDILFIWAYLWPWLRRHGQHPYNVFAAMTSVAAISLPYCVYMNPVQTYDIQMNLLLFSSILFVVPAASILCLLSFVVYIPSHSTKPARSHT